MRRSGWQNGAAVLPSLPAPGRPAWESCSRQTAASESADVPTRGSYAHAFPARCAASGSEPGHLMFCSQIHRRQPLQILFGLASLRPCGSADAPAPGSPRPPVPVPPSAPQHGSCPGCPGSLPSAWLRPGLFPRMPCLLLGQPPCRLSGGFTSLFNILTHITPIELPDSSDGPWKKGYNLLPVFMIPLFDTFVNPLFPGKPLISLGFPSFLR